jgi:hypothetical protein
MYKENAQQKKAEPSLYQAFPLQPLRSNQHLHGGYETIFLK